MATQEQVVSKAKKRRLRKQRAKLRAKLKMDVLRKREFEDAMKSQLSDEKKLRDAPHSAEHSAQRSAQGSTAPTITFDNNEQYDPASPASPVVPHKPQTFDYRDPPIHRHWNKKVGRGNVDDIPASGRGRVPGVMFIPQLDRNYEKIRLRQELAAANKLAM